MRLDDFRALVDATGATLEISDAGRSVTYTVDAPRGMLWGCDRIHWLTASVWAGTGGLGELRAELAERMRYGVEPCEDLDCEVCNDDS